MQVESAMRSLVRGTTTQVRGPITTSSRSMATGRSATRSREGSRPKGGDEARLEATRMSSPDRLQIVRRLLESLAQGDEASLNTLDSTQAELMENFGPAGSPLPQGGLLDDPIVSAALDIQQAMALMDTSDASFPWNAASLAAEAGRYVEAAFDYLEAARRSEADISAGTPALPDERDWVESALYLASKNFVLGGHPVSAAIVQRRLKSEVDRREIDELVRSRVVQNS